MNASDDVTAKLAHQGFGLIKGLCLQFLLGILTLIYVAFPESGGPREMWEFARTQPLVIAHIILGTLLILGAAVLHFKSHKSKNRVWTIASGAGFLSILGAWLAGEEFVSNQNDSFSLLMSLFFITGIFSYVWGIYHTKIHPPTAQRSA